jgi:hypothetical protein
MAIGRMGIH